MTVDQGEALFAQGKLSEARDCFQQVLTAEPGNKRAHNNLGVLAFREGDAERAIVHFTEALQADPHYYEANDNLQMILSQLDRSQVRDSSVFSFSYLHSLIVTSKITHQTDDAVRQLIESLEGSQKVLLLALLHQGAPDRPVALDARYTGKLVDMLVDSEPESSPETIVSALESMSADAALAVETRLQRRGVRSTAQAMFRESSIPASDAAKGLRVLHGTCEIANQMHTATEELKRLGGHAHTVCYYPNYLQYKADHVLDVGAFGDPTEAVRKSQAMAQALIPEFDIFHFHFATSLTLDYSDLPVLKDKGKKMVAHFWGSDVRMLSRAIRINPYIKVKVIDEDMIRRKLEHLGSFISDCVVTDFELYEYVSDFFEYVHIIPAMIDASQYQPDPSAKRKKFHIVHAPTAPEEKGSRYIVKALDDLKATHDFEFTYVKGMSHDEAKRVYASADLVIDQLHGGAYGLFSIECMSMGKPVITWVCDYMQSKYPGSLPVISANPDTVKQKIVWALDNREEIAAIGARGTDYVRTYHDAHRVIAQYIDLYRAL